VNYQDFFSGGKGAGRGFMGMGLEDILDALRGGMGGSRKRKSRRAAGRDLEHHVTLDFMQAALGTTATIRLRRSREGDGRTETIDVKIPPGVHTGSKIRLRGQGVRGKRNSGDLYITISVRPHEYFSADGRDVTVELPISVTEAVLGASVDVPTIDSMTTVKIPPGTSSGQRLRLRRKGIGKDARRGDQYVVIKIISDKNVSAGARKLLEEYAETQKSDPRKDAPWR